MDRKTIKSVDDLQEIATSLAEMSTSLEQVSKSSEELAGLAAGLQQAVERFRM